MLGLVHGIVKHPLNIDALFTFEKVNVMTDVTHPLHADLYIVQ